MIQRSVIIGAIIIFLLPCTGLAVPTDFTENYTYTAGEADSKLTCRMVSLIEVKRLLLEKIGVYLESRTEVKNFKLEKDEIVALTAGIVKLEILDEKWNGEKYSLTAKIQADPKEITRSIEELKKQKRQSDHIDKLKEINDESLEQIRNMQARLQQLQGDLVKINQDASANQGLLNAWGLFEKAVELRQTGKTEEALTLLNKVIQYNPTRLAYFERGMAYLELETHDKAIADFTEALKSEPNMRGALWYRGLAYNRSGDKKMGRNDIEKAAELNNPMAIKWLKEHPGYGGGGFGTRKGPWR